jgi:RNA polymerase sigma-70 factor (family 1)
MTPTRTHSDEELLRLLQLGEESAFSDIYDRYWKELFISAQKIMRDRAVAQDAVQEVFISLWNRRAEIQLVSLRAWLFQSVRFQVFKAIRHQKGSRQVMDELARVSMDMVDGDPIRFRELQDIITRIINSLPDDQQEFFRMNREQGKTYREIAAEKNISVKTVEKKMSAALKNINSQFDNPLTIVLLMHILTTHSN